jgi:hypothetical protein
LLASFPQLGDAGQPLEASYDADLLVEPYDPELGKLLHESVGENSIFHARTGYYADVMLPAVKETFPRGWEERLVPLPGCEAARCLDPHDLGAIKLQAGREKDLALCAALLAAGILKPDLIRDRFQKTRMTEHMMALTDQRLAQAIDRAQKRSTPSGKE